MYVSVWKFYSKDSNWFVHILSYSVQAVLDFWMFNFPTTCMFVHYKFLPLITFSYAKFGLLYMAAEQTFWAIVKWHCKPSQNFTNKVVHFINELNLVVTIEDVHELIASCSELMSNEDLIDIKEENKIPPEATDYCQSSATRAMSERNERSLWSRQTFLKYNGRLWSKCTEKFAST